MHWHWHYTAPTNKIIINDTTNVLSVQPTQTVLFLQCLVFPLFCPSPVCSQATFLKSLFTHTGILPGEQNKAPWRRCVTFYTMCVTELPTLFPNSFPYIKVIWVEATGTRWLQTTTNKVCSKMCPHSIHGYPCCMSSQWLVEIMHSGILQDK